jgi:hypothetical protein
MTNEEFERILETNPPATALQGEIGYQDLALFAEWLMQTIHAMRETMPRWIPVSEGLPKREDHTVLGERYLVLYDGFYHNIDVFYPYSKTWYSKFYNVTEHVTHWMPLPPLPKEMK